MPSPTFYIFDLRTLTNIWGRYGSKWRIYCYNFAIYHPNWPYDSLNQRSCQALHFILFDLRALTNIGGRYGSKSRVYRYNFLIYHPNWSYDSLNQRSCQALRFIFFNLRALTNIGGRYGWNRMFCVITLWFTIRTDHMIA